MFRILAFTYIFKFYRYDEKFDTAPFLFMENFFSIIFLKHLRIYSVLWSKKISTKSWYLFLCENFFHTRNFPEHWRVPPKFLALWDKKLSTQNRDIPLFCIKFFDIRIFLKPRRVLLRIFFGLWDKKISSENRDKITLIIFCIKYRNQWWGWYL